MLVDKAEKEYNKNGAKTNGAAAGETSTDAAVGFEDDEDEAIIRDARRKWLKNKGIKQIPRSKAKASKGDEEEVDES
jgi:hypothetical protein